MKKKNKKEKKTFCQEINLSSLEEISSLVSDNYDAFAHAYTFRDKTKKRHKFEYYNLLCTCILRIRETSNYVIGYSFKQENVCGQAFDFYEFVSCLSIIFSCVESLLDLFNFKLKEDFKNKQYFIKSNRTKESDYKFFKFVRSAAVAHPDNTTKYPKIAKRTNEIYPYAVWTCEVFDLLRTEKDKDSDISLLSWASSERSKYKRYYLYVDEFFAFINAVVKDLGKVVPAINAIIETFRNKHRCRRLKKEDDFQSYHDYLMYLRKRLLSLNTNKYEYPDGGILLADHIISNSIIGDEFKKYIRKRIMRLTKMMIDNFDEIGFYFVFDELDLYRVIKDKVDDSGYIDEKFNSYLKREAIYEIGSDSFRKFIPELVVYKDNPEDGSDAFWATYLLFSCTTFVDKYKSYSNYEKLSYVDIYEMALEIIFEETIGEK